MEKLRITVTEAERKIENLILKCLEEKDHNEIDLLQRKIDILKDFIYFKKDLES